MSRTHRNFINDGFAFWITCLDSNYQSDIHINEWLNPNSQNFIDFGLRIYEAKKVSTINIYISFPITLSEIVDLSNTLSNEKVARGIFNTLCTIKHSSNNPLIEIEYNNRKENIAPLSAFDLSLHSCNTGTLLTLSLIKIKEIMTYNEVYIRFRLPHKSMNSIFLSRHLDYRSIFDSPIITHRYHHNIRFNEVRSLPSEIRNIPEFELQNVEKIILTLSANEKYNVDDNNCYKIRQLEEDLYSAYVPDNFNCMNTITYQWLMESKKHYNFNIKVYFDTISKRSLLMFIFIIICISLLSDILWEGLVCILKR